ncbi:MAG: YheT family hydrolase [Porticoccaceae bacterium]|nr:hypothetical protein [Porticoccaceae bacterium]MBL6895148.1 alpha/beta fold hydrolase [Porticoccaceae bacterium]PDH30672.1 MAG: hypothetical protein CND57_03295 [SAR92 bacterium MED-G29]
MTNTKIPKFIPPRYLENAHIQSIMNSVGPRKFRAKKIARQLKSEQIIIKTIDGVRLTAEYDNSPIKTSSKTAESLVVLIHGWEGSSQSAYQVTTAHTLLMAGYNVLRLNLRDHGESHHLNKEVFNSTLTKEVGDAIKSFTSQYNFKYIYLAGFSLGANFTLRIAADRAKELGLRAAVGICPPIDPNAAMSELNKSLFIYEKYFFRRWTRSLTKKLNHFPELSFGPDLAQVKTLDDVNKTFVPKFTPFKDAKTYFSSYALVGDRLKGLEIPAYIISAENDPILPRADLSKIPQIDNLTVELHPNGGHCGFISDLKGKSWIEGRLVQIFDES